MALNGYATAFAVKPAVVKIARANSSPGLSRSLILVVDDDWGVRESLILLLAAAGYQATAAQNGLEALQCIQKQAPTLLMCDLEMPRMSGPELLQIVRRQFPGIAVIAMSGSYADDTVPEGLMADAFYCKGTQRPTDLFRMIADVIRTSDSRGQIHSTGVSDKHF